MSLAMENIPLKILNLIYTMIPALWSHPLSTVWVPNVQGPSDLGPRMWGSPPPSIQAYCIHLEEQRLQAPRVCTYVAAAATGWVMVT